MSAELTSARVSSDDAFAAIETYFERGWTDGLPVVPPTPDRVEAMLDAAGLDPDEVLARVEARAGLEVTAEKLAVNAVMAGATPDLMPVIAAGMRALGDPRHNAHSHTATLSGAVQVAIVNGPIRHRLGINSTNSALGPGWRANATIGRALRLAIRNALRSVPGELDRAAFSHPGRFSWCFGEDEEGSPWSTVAEDQGLAPHQDAVTMYASMWQSTAVGDPRDPAELLDLIALGARTAIQYGWRAMSNIDASDNSSFRPLRRFLFVTGREHVRILHEAGLDKAAVRAEIHRRWVDERPGLDPVAADSPDHILLAVVRGDGMYQTHFFFPFYSSAPITEPVRTP